jgi:hypothetical protein
MAIRIQFRRGTSTEWSSANPVLAEGELVLETDTLQVKLGDGTTQYNSLAYGGVAGPTGPVGPGGPTGPQGENALLESEDVYIFMNLFS